MTEQSPPLNKGPGVVWKRTRRVFVFIIGGTLLLAGIALVVLPGPAFVVIPIALALLGTEFVWAKRLLKKAKRQLKME